MVKDICTNISFYEFEKYTNNWFKKKDIHSAVDVIFNIFNKGYSVVDIIEEELKYKIIRVICQYISIFHTIHETELELVLFTKHLIKILD